MQDRPVFIIHTFIIIKFQLSNMYRIVLSETLLVSVGWGAGGRTDGRMDGGMIINFYWTTCGPRNEAKLFPC